MTEEARRQDDQPEPAPEEGTPSPAEEQLQAQLEAARREARENWDRFLRAVADNENYRRRVERDLALTIRRGKGDLLREFLGLRDNLERALTAAGEEQALRRGLEVILRQFDAVLEKEGVAPIPAVGLPFDPFLHEVLAVEEDPAVEEEVVREELGRGYRYGDEVLRPARVRVARPAPPS